MKKLNVLAIIFGIGLFVSCSTSDVEEEIGLEDDVELKSEKSIKIPPRPPLPGPCGLAFNCPPK
ncbi:hypothetical protein [uncultured Aquimarina sp.]|uniref:hypothetical protein n=1 Tax=uncultured Aquimarina sp. TaxID=575652 RepID=UPI002628DF21|nr:hypothetical protein [uncultured Aquimarina sp.]